MTTVVYILEAIFFGWLCLFIRRLHVKQRRRERGECIACGYDLRASGGVCPECGVGQAG